jgi:hypothetical protein
MNARQSVVGFDFSRYNRDYLAHAHAGTNGSSQGRNDAERYEVRIVPAQVEPGQLYWRAIGVRHLEPAENTGKHNLYAELLDEEGKRVRDANVQLARGWEGQRPDEKSPLVRFDKGENEPATNVPIDRNQKLWVAVASDLPSDRVENLHTKHADEPGPNGELWNSIGHHSFYVVFQRTRSAGSTPPIVVPPLTEPAEPPPVSTGSSTNIGDDATYIEGHDALPALAVVQPRQRFEQSWRVYNSSRNAWDETYRVVRVGGASLDAPAQVPTPICHPGSETTITVPFTAPAEPGPYHTVWRMANSAGEVFGERLWLVIVVAGTRDAVHSGGGQAGGTDRAAGRNLRPSTTQGGQLPEATRRLPETAPSGDAGASGAVRDPELYAAWKTHIENGFANNQLMFQQLLNGFMNPYWTTVWMYRILFGLGVASFLVAAGLSAFAGKEGYTLIFGGLSALSLLAYFFNHPLQALEENLQFITWLGLIYNSYWTRLVYLNSQPDVQQGLQDATDDAIERIKELMDEHALRAGKRQSLGE